MKLLTDPVAAGMVAVGVCCLIFGMGCIVVGMLLSFDDPIPAAPLFAAGFAALLTGVGLIIGGVAGLVRSVRRRPR